MGVVIIGAYIGLGMVIDIAVLKVEFTYFIFSIILARAVLLIAFSNAISHDSIKARKILLYSFAIESLIEILFSCYIYY